MDIFVHILSSRKFIVSYQKTIMEILDSLNANKISLGYDYVTYGLSLIFDNPRRTFGIIKSLYIDIADHYDTTWNCVEKNIRGVVKSIWVHDNNDMLQKIFHKAYDEKRPTNKEFFKAMYDYIIYGRDTVQIKTPIKIICPISQQYCEAFSDYCMYAVKSYELYNCDDE